MNTMAVDRCQSLYLFIRYLPHFVLFLFYVILPLDDDSSAWTEKKIRVQVLMTKNHHNYII